MNLGSDSVTALYAGETQITKAYRGSTQVYTSAPPTPTWDAVTTLSEHSGWVHSAKVSPDGNYLASSNEDGNAYVYNTSDWSLYATYSGAAGMWITDVAWSPDSTKLAFCEYHPTNASAAQKVYVLNISDGTDATGNGQLATVNARCREIAFSPDGNYVAFSAETATTYIYKTSDWTQETTLAYQAEGIAWSNDENYFAIADVPNSRYVLFNVGTWTVARTGAGTGASRGERVFFSPDSTKLAFADSTYDVFIYLVSSGAQDTGSPTGYTGFNTGQVRGMEWSDDGRWLAFSAKEGTATKAFIVDVEDGYTEEIAIDVGNFGAYGVHFSPGTVYFVVACQSGGNVRIYNVY